MRIELPLGFYTKTNESGTHIHKDFLKIRVDLYPPEGSTLYELHYVSHGLNPCLCHFIKVGPDITKEQLGNIIKDIFDAETLQKLDSELLKDNNIQEISRIMNPKCGGGKELGIGKEEHQSLIDQVNSRVRETEIGD